MVLSIDQWVGKLAVVTGASAGIGAAISKTLAEQGINVSFGLQCLMLSHKKITSSILHHP